MRQAINDNADNSSRSEGFGYWPPTSPPGVTALLKGVCVTTRTTLAVETFNYLLTCSAQCSRHMTYYGIGEAVHEPHQA